MGMLRTAAFILAATCLLAAALAGQDAKTARGSAEPNAAQETIGADSNLTEPNVRREGQGAIAGEGTPEAGGDAAWRAGVEG
ncbi:MAG: hypothetical protein JSU94_05190 [Phycisphaerales bacterium]|nr:MAG: hypothetical protein JSU94_05190 [Phycisphaerales bacterium]